MKNKGYLVYLMNKRTRVKHCEAVVAPSRYLATVEALRLARTGYPGADFEIWEVRGD